MCTEPATPALPGRAANVSPSGRSRAGAVTAPYCHFLPAGGGVGGRRGTPPRAAPHQRTPPLPRRPSCPSLTEAAARGGPGERGAHRSPASLPASIRPPARSALGSLGSPGPPRPPPFRTGTGSEAERPPRWGGPQRQAGRHGDAGVAPRLGAAQRHAGLLKNDRI